MSNIKNITARSNDSIKNSFTSLQPFWEYEKIIWRNPKPHNCLVFPFLSQLVWLHHRQRSHMFAFESCTWPRNTENCASNTNIGRVCVRIQLCLLQVFIVWLIFAMHAQTTRIHYHHRYHNYFLSTNWGVRCGKYFTQLICTKWYKRWNVTITFPTMAILFLTMQHTHKMFKWKFLSKFQRSWDNLFVPSNALMPH